MYTHCVAQVFVADLQQVARGCACQAARRAARELTRAYDESLRPSGLRTTQFSILVAVALMRAPTMSRLAEAVGLERTTLTRDLRPLSERGLVAVGPGADRRSRVVELTDAGRAAVAAAMPHWRRAQAAYR
jgi:DNA-binding MarR family transcriptional regulator